MGELVDSKLWKKKNLKELNKKKVERILNSKSKILLYMIMYTLLLFL